MVTTRDQEKLLALWRASVSQITAQNRDELLRLTAHGLRHAFDPVRILFYLATPPPEVEPLRLIPCPAQELAPAVFVYDSASQGDSFDFITECPYWAPLSSSRHHFGWLFLETMAGSWLKLEQQFIDLVAVRLACHLDRLKPGHPGQDEPPPPLPLAEFHGCVLIEGQPLHLSEPELILLRLLYERQGQVCSRELICQQVYAGEVRDFLRREGRLDSVIARLRKKLKQIPQCRITITTVYGLGYRLDVLEG
jgi:hypothetical protein